MPSALVMEPGDERMHAPTAWPTGNGRTAHSSPAVVRRAATVGTAVCAGLGTTPATDTAVGAAGQESGVGSRPQAVGYLDRRRLGAGIERIRNMGFGLSARYVARVIGAAAVTAGAMVMSAPLPAASAQPCPDVEVVFARGTAEPPGVGGVGQSFVDAVRAQADGKSVSVYPVNYAASADFADRIGFATSFVEGIRDAGNHVEATAANCPNTRIVLGGFSQGAAVAGFVTSASIPPGIPPEFLPFIPNPMPSEVANHVATVALFGKPSETFLRDVGAPPVEIGPLYADKTIDLCAADDTICNGAPVGGPSFAHALYGVNGMVGEAASFAMGKL